MPVCGGGGGSRGSSGFKKGGFRNAFSEVGPAKKEDVVGKENPDRSSSGDVMMHDVTEKQREGPKSEGKKPEREDDWNRWGDYDPRRPTGCSDRCPGRK